MFGVFNANNENYAEFFETHSCSDAELGLVDGEESKFYATDSD